MAYLLIRKCLKWDNFYIYKILGYFSPGVTVKLLEQIQPNWISLLGLPQKNVTDWVACLVK